MASVYSTRLLITTGANNWVAYTVPAGQRAVLRTIVAANDIAEVWQAYAHFSGHWVLRESYQAAITTRYYDMRVVLYAGEALTALKTSSNASLHFHGYLFSTAGGAADAPPLNSAGQAPPGYELSG